MTGKLSAVAMCLVVVSVVPMMGQQADRGVRVLSVEVQAPSRQPAQTPFLIPYGGDLGTDTVVRVFRGSKKQLTEEIPSQTRDGECVLYTATVTYPVTSDGHMLHMDRVYESWDLSWRASHQQTQVFTLVFERGGANLSNGQLRLSKSDVKTYFLHAIEWPMYATDDMILTYQREKARNAPPSSGVLSRLGGLFGGVFNPTPVSAASRPTPVSAALSVAPPPIPVDHRPCNTVRTSSVASRVDGTSDESVVAELVPAFAVRDTTACAL